MLALSGSVASIILIMNLAPKRQVTKERKFDIILGHRISAGVQELVYEVLYAFPSKELLIHPYDLADVESGKQVDPKAQAVSMPEIDEYIVIWIKPNLETEEFNAVLAEELVHHLQAKDGFCQISGLIPLPGFHYNPVAIIKGFTDPLTSCVWDIASRSTIIEKKIDVSPLLKMDYRNAMHAINEAKSSPEKFEKLKRGEGRISNFPNYLLWWYDLSKLNIKPFSELWKDEVYPGFEDVMNYDVLNEWNELTSFVGEFDKIGKDDANQIMTKVCEQLIGARPVLERKRTRGRKLKELRITELVPPQASPP